MVTLGRGVPALGGVSVKPYMDHKWLTSAYHEKGPSRLAKELGVSDKTINYWVKKLDIPRIGTAGNARKHRVNETFFESIDDELKAYWLGFIMADGCVYCGDSPASYRFQMNLSVKDAGHLELFNSTVQSNYPLIYKTVHGNNNQLYQVVQLKINNTTFCHHLMRHGVKPRKSGRELIPDLDNSQLLHHFVRGYFDGDGSISVNNRGQPSVIIAAASERFISQLHEILTEIGVTRARIRYHNGAYALSFTNRKSILSLADYMYADATVLLMRKKEIFDTLLV